MRRCESPFETYFIAKNRCLSFEFQDTNEDAGVCPDGQELLDGPGNLGVCACQSHHDSLVNPKDHMCYQQFTQVYIIVNTSFYSFKIDRK